MTGPDVIDIARDGIFTLVLVAGPVMLVGLTVGVVVGLLQAVTQVQEATLVYVPKILAIFATMLLAFPLMGATMASYMERIVARIASGG
ncbi:flagellar biosynthesis protein FliQ [Pinisolibacter sp.]|uniref:flagellar biosynthesis protein FliQ n=1 Tax=Pinisolibacter sp. TaxID=2172024 RepID=UPI002FDEE777